MPVVIIAGSIRDEQHVEEIKKHIYELKHGWLIPIHYISAHKNTRELLAKIEEYDAQPHVIFVTVAGLSNALSGVVASNTKHPVIACPPFKSTEDYMVDIHSTMRMPSNVPVLTVLNPLNCALAVVRLIRMCQQEE